MVKSELISLIADKVPSLSQKDVEMSINHILETMSNSLSSGQRLEFRGFGSFSLRYQPPRDAWNPKTKKPVATIGKHRPHFKAGKELRDRVNEQYGKPMLEKFIPSQHFKVNQQPIQQRVEEEAEAV